MFLLLVLVGCDCTALTAEQSGRKAGQSAAQAGDDPRRPGEQGTGERSKRSIELGPRGCASGVQPLGDRVQKGVCYAHNYQRGGTHGYGSDVSLGTLRELRKMGVEWLSLTPFGFMRSLQERKVHHVGNMRGGETDARMRRAFSHARKLGLKILLKPHIWVHGGAWRGKIDPGSHQGWEAWFSSYRTWILHYARMAQEHDIPIFAIGTEFVSSARKFPDRWRAIAEAVRNVYDGKIVYAANWDIVPELSWWDAVDYMGVQFYPPLADREDATVETMRKRMDYYVDVLEGLVDKWDRPVLFTEVGYKSTRGTEAHPHTWPEHIEGEPEVSERDQAVAYRVFLNGVHGHEWVRGIYWWKMFTDPSLGEEGPAGFSPRGKLAESVLRAAYDPACR